MKKFLIYSLSILVPVYLGISIVNYVVDPGHVYSDAYIDNVVQGLKEGKNVANVADLNERSFKEKFIQAHAGEDYDYAIIGASRVMTLSTDVFDDNRVINLGMPGSKIEDLIAIYQLCKDNNIKYKNVLLGVEPTYFNANDPDTRWKYLQKYYDAFMGTQEDQSNLSLLSTLFSALSNDANNDYSKEGADMLLITNLFSVSYFIAGIKNLINGDAEVLFVDTPINDGATKRLDGSICYSKAFRDRDQSVIDEGAAYTWMHHSFENFNSLSEERKVLFGKLIDSLQKDSVNIIFLKGAYHPLFYKRIIKTGEIIKGDKYLDEFAQKNSIPVFGSINPDDVGLKNTDYYDATHLRKESLDKLFKDWNIIN